MASYELYTEIWEMTILKRSTDIEEEKKEKERIEQDKIDGLKGVLDLGKTDTRSEEEVEKYQWSIKLSPSLDFMTDSVVFH
jgi:hypothetical protein